MYLRITRGTFDPAATAAVAALIGELRDATMRLPGHAHARVGLDRRGGRCVRITSWDTEAHARFAREQFAELVAGIAAAGLVLEPPEVYELVAG